MNPQNRSYLALHIAVFLFGFTAILGRLIDLNGFEIVWYRMLFTALSFLFLPKMIKKLRRIPVGHRRRLMFIGVLVSLHWIAFFASIKFSNVTVALSVLSTSAFFTSITEPLIYRKKFKKEEILLGLMVVTGMYLIFSFGGDYIAGIILGLVAAMLSAVFSVLNRKMVSRYDPVSITFIELGSGWLFLVLLTPLYLFLLPVWDIPELRIDMIPSLTDLQYLLVLALLCTTLAYVLALGALRHITAFTSNLSINLEPIYGIIMAYFIFHENQELDNRFYWGTAIIILSIFVHTLLNRRRRRKVAA